MKVINSMFLLLLFACGQAQPTIDDTLHELNKGTVPYISVEELAGMANVALIDTREKEEYEVSHLKNALWVGYNDFDISRVKERIKDRSGPVVVYCSVGVRSEDIGERLLAEGYTDVKNLYGGIFEWKNEGYPVYDTSGKETEKVHAYNQYWGKLLHRGEKVY